MSELVMETALKQWMRYYKHTGNGEGFWIVDGPTWERLEGELDARAAYTPGQMRGPVYEISISTPMGAREVVLWKRAPNSGIAWVPAPEMV